jgi:hypothetical protein
MSDIASNHCRVQAASIAASLLAQLALQLSGDSDSSFRSSDTQEASDVAQVKLFRTGESAGDACHDQFYCPFASSDLYAASASKTQVANQGTQEERQSAPARARFVEQVDTPAALAVQDYLSHLFSLDDELPVLLLRPCMVPVQCIGPFVRSLQANQREHVASLCLRQCLGIVDMRKGPMPYAVKAFDHSRKSDTHATAECPESNSTSGPAAVAIHPCHTGSLRIHPESIHPCHTGSLRIHPESMSTVASSQCPRSGLFWLQAGVSLVHEGCRIQTGSELAAMQLSTVTMDSGGLCPQSDSETAEGSNVLLAAILQATGCMLQQPNDGVHVGELCKVLDACLAEDMALTGRARRILESAIASRSEKGACVIALGLRSPVKRKLHRMLDQWGDEIIVLQAQMACLEAQIVC